ncbi:MAG TPA: terminase family protein [Deinococcales bacterium]|nr:terminase family protein [Deinococcales bacterium]
MLGMLTRIQAAQRKAQAWASAPPSTNPTTPGPDLTAYWQARYPKYHLARHIQALLRELETLGPGDAVIITMPPRHSKTESVKAWLEWNLGRDPTSDVMYASYSVDLARRSSRSIRNEIEGGLAFPAFYPGTRLAADAQSATDWATEAGGHFRAAGVGGGLTGMGARLAVVDDPFKDRKQAESSTTREGVWDWFTSVFLTRLSPDATVVVMHTRWHPDDLAGRILARLEAGESDELGGLRWRHVTFPAIAEGPDELGRVAGEALWPERYNLKRLQALRAVNEYDFSALYQQQPRIRGGSVFKDQVARYTPGTPLPPGSRLVICCDTASSKRQAADYTACVVMAATGRAADTRARIIDVRHGRWDITELRAVAMDLQRTYGTPLHLERTGQSLPIIQHLREQGLQVRELHPAGDKFTRAQPYAAAWNNARIELPGPDPKTGATPAWVGPFLAEHLAFTGTDADDHDDQVDAAGYAFNQLAANGNDPQTIARLTAWT